MAWKKGKKIKQCTDLKKSRIESLVVGDASLIVLDVVIFAFKPTHNVAKITLQRTPSIFRIVYAYIFMYTLQPPSW